MENSNSRGSALPASTRAPAEESAAPGRSRLIVVVQDPAPEALLASRLVQVARLHERDVTLFGVAGEQVEEGRLRREIAPLAGLIREAGVRVETSVSSGRRGWARLNELLREDDMLACAPSDGTTRGGQSLVETLASTWHGPIHVFDSGSPRGHERPALWRSVVPWILSAVIILGFFGLDVWISHLVSGSAMTIITLALLAPEIGLLWLSNSLFS